MQSRAGLQLLIKRTSVRRLQCSLPEGESVKFRIYGANRHFHPCLVLSPACHAPPTHLQLRPAHLHELNLAVQPAAVHHIPQLRLASIPMHPSLRTAPSGTSGNTLHHTNIGATP